MLVPVPVMAPGLIVQVPVEGKEFRITLPVGTLQVACVIVDTEGLVVATTTSLPVIVAVQYVSFVAKTV